MSGAAVYDVRRKPAELAGFCISWSISTRTRLLVQIIIFSSMGHPTYAFHLRCINLLLM